MICVDALALGGSYWQEDKSNVSDGKHYGEYESRCSINYLLGKIKMVTGKISSFALSVVSYLSPVSSHMHCSGGPSILVHDLYHKDIFKKCQCHKYDAGQNPEVQDIESVRGWCVLMRCSRFVDEH